MTTPHAAIVLAAGRSTRMGGPNKLLAELDGKKLARIVAEQALASKASEVIVVTGHQADLVEQALPLQGEGDATRLADQQWLPEPLFQLAHLMAERTDGQVHRCRCP